MSRFRGLDGLRALSVILVISVHVHMDDLPFAWLCGSGGVSIFFVLSGFLITTLALREENERGSLNLRAFYVRRSLRIFPAYYYVLGATALLIYRDGAQNPDQLARWNDAMPYYLFYFNEFAPAANFFHSWSLAIEEKFYLVWPFVAFSLFKLKPERRFVLAAAVGACLLLRPVSFLFFLVGDYGFISIGCLLALCLHNRAIYERARTLGRPLWSWLVPAAFAAAHFAVSHGRLDLHPIGDFSYAVAIALLLATVVISNPIWSRPLDWRWMRFVGVRAYGIYLVHVFCVGIAEAVFGQGTGKAWVAWSAYLTSALLAIAFAHGLYLLIERPLIEQGRKWSRAILAESHPAAAQARYVQ